MLNKEIFLKSGIKLGCALSLSFWLFVSYNEDICEHPCTYLIVGKNMSWLHLGTDLQSRISRSEYMKFQFYKTIKKNSFPGSLYHIILSHQQCMGDLVYPHSHIHLILSNFLIFTVGYSYFNPKKITLIRH